MPTDWSYASEALDLGGTGEYRIAAEEAERQTTTARTILERLRDQPGIVLADEVGMGKTYVALAVVTSVLLATRHASEPVVVMVPPGLAGKWQREWQRFKSKCSTNGALAWMEGRDRFAASPTEFFKLLDDPRDRRARLIWLTTSCFAQGLGDGWMKLALVRLARRHTRMDDEEKQRLYKWATALTRLRSKRNLTPAIVERLMISDPADWKSVLVSSDLLSAEDDDPVPRHLLKHADDEKLDWRPLIDVLHGNVPGRRGRVSSERLTDARGALNEALQELYWAWLGRVKWKASLLVLDEAHHAKNDATKLASLFRSADLTKLIEGHDENPPLFWKKAERMLFLTATPFQLGHQELIRVLRSFAAVRWHGPAAPSKGREAFVEALKELEGRLNENRLAGRRLDALWGRLTPPSSRPHGSVDPLEAAAEWWTRLPADSAESLVQDLRRAVDDCRQTKAKAESDAGESWKGLRAWVIRHNRATRLPAVGDEPLVARRVHRLGDGIRSGGEESSSGATGLPLSGAAALPFLLAVRAQTELATSAGQARAYFAEGLSSSYEAFHHTRAERGDVREAGGETPATEDSATGAPDPTVIPVSWYEEHVASLVPSRDKPQECLAHPKVKAVVARAIELWLTGEKVLIFCFYRETAKALRDHLRRGVDRALAQRAAARLGLPPDRPEEAHDLLVRAARRLADRDSPFHGELKKILEKEVDATRFEALVPWREKIIEALSAYMRSPAFIARFLPLDEPQVREALRPGETRAEVIRHGTLALRRSFEQATDSSGQTMAARVRGFLSFARELADHGAATDPGDGDERRAPLEEYLKAVTVSVDPGTDEDDEQESKAARTFRALPTVRMVYGQTRRDVRERVMLAFNGPLYPEILVSSSVLAEGVDLHRFCRHLIHHDLCWNPSTLEQRTGRLDRIHCKAEATRRSIIVYEPFLAGSADEKMFRVVRDRERWFQVVMGQQFDLDERTTEALASRVPLPDSIAKDLVFDLRCWFG